MLQTYRLRATAEHCVNPEIELNSPSNKSYEILSVAIDQFNLKVALDFLIDESVSTSGINLSFLYSRPL